MIDNITQGVFNLSLSARRAWIEISSLDDILAGVKSLSARRAWIEIRVPSSTVIVILSLSARRAWIEISSLDDILAGVNGRSPQGERG